MVGLISGVRWTATAEQTERDHVKPPGVAQCPPFSTGIDRRS
jgi:hypothetical protein